MPKHFLATTARSPRTQLLLALGWTGTYDDDELPVDRLTIERAWGNLNVRVVYWKDGTRCALEDPADEFPSSRLVAALRLVAGS